VTLQHCERVEMHEELVERMDRPKARFRFTEDGKLEMEIHDDHDSRRDRR